MNRMCRKYSQEFRPLKAVQAMMGMLIFFLVCAGCSGGASISPKSTRNLGAGNASKIGGIGADRPPNLVTGSKFIYRETRPFNANTGKIIMEVKEKKEFEKKQAYWIEMTGEETSYINLYDMNLNWIGSLGDGKKLESAEPCIQLFKWPLTIGKKWVSEYTHKNYSPVYHSFFFNASVNVMSYEEVTVPAGTFQVLRIQADDEAYWYAPSIGWFVREQIGSYDTRRVRELVEYSIP